MRAPARLATAISIVGGLMFIGPAAAFAIGLSTSAEPVDLQAGANSDFNIEIDISESSDQIRDLTIHLPPGLIANPLAPEFCTEADFEADACSEESKVGDVSSNVTIPALMMTADFPGEIFNLVPEPGEPARLGNTLVTPLGTVHLQAPAALRESDFGLDTFLTDIPNTAGGLQIHINSIDFTLFGEANDPPVGFMRNPTSCVPATTGFDAVAHTNETASDDADPFTPTGCDSLAFDPGFSATLTPMGTGGLKPELTTAITQTPTEAGLKRAVVVLPPDLGADNAVLANQCAEDQFEGHACPANTIVGTATAASPFLPTALTGAVALLPPEGGLPRVGLDLLGLLPLQLIGQFVLTPQGTGVEFAGLPDIPITNFALTFTGGDNGLVVASRPVCDPPPLEFNSTFDAHSGATVAKTTPATVVGECPPKAEKKPNAKIKLRKLGTDEPRMKVSVKAGTDELRKATIKMPKVLGFASGKKFDKGTKAQASARRAKAKVKHTKRKLTLRRKQGTRRFRATIDDGALKRLGKIKGGDRLKFRVKARDVDGDLSKIVAKGTARL
ncbi:MAG: hypothetical protein ACRDK9_01565 [Solirubrobacterales bacterium]